MSNTYQDYLRDLVYVLRERGAAAQAAATHSDLDRERAFAYAEVLSLMQTQADAFDIPRDDILLGDFDPLNGPLDPPSPDHS